MLRDPELAQAGGSGYHGAILAKFSQESRGG